MNSNSSQLQPARLRNVVITVLLVGVAIGLFTGYFIQRFRAEARASNENWASQKFGLTSPVQNRLSDGYSDADGDLLADCPTDASSQLNPEQLVYAYIAGDEVQTAELWQPLIDALSTATGREVSFRSYANIEEQLAALAAGELHVCGLNTGVVPRAVNNCGFIPAATIGRDDQSFGIYTKIIVPASSDIQDVQDLKGKLITFTNTSSNSGFKAPVVILKEEYGMRPEQDYKYGFSTAHDESIRRIAANELVAAAVASDLIERAIASDQIAADSVRVIYTSARFPPAAFGYIYNLNPELAAKISAALTSFELSDEQLRSTLGAAGASRLVPVSYKDDWALIRLIDNAMGIKHESPNPSAGGSMPEDSEPPSVEQEL